MPDVSERFKQAAKRGGKLITKSVCTLPSGEPIDLQVSAASVSTDLSSASRYTSNLTLTRNRNDLFDLVTIPGAKFSLDHGFDFGAGYTDVIPMGRYEVARNSANVFGGELRIDLVDQWARLERASFLVPYTPPAGRRADAIANAVAAAIPGVTVNIIDAGGTHAGGKTWDRSRTQMINDLSTDGGLDCYFDAAGVFVIRTAPILTPAASAWTFTSGEEANIIDADRERPFDRLYNKVIVVPQDETQTWTAQVVELTDTSHPLHESKYGPAPYFWASPTLTSAASARAAGITILQRVQGKLESLSITSFGNAALEAGKTVTVVGAPTETDAGFSAFHLLESTNYDCMTAAVQAATRSTTLAAIEEAA